MRNSGVLVRIACVCLLAISLTAASGQRLEAAGVTQLGKSHVITGDDAVVLAKKDGKGFKNNSKDFKGNKNGKKFKKKNQKFKHKKVKNKKVKKKKIKNKKIKHKKVKKFRKKG